MAKESHKEFLFLIRGFSNQKTHGERRVSDLKKRMLDLTSDLESANSDLDAVKQSREMADQELKGTQFQLAMTCASIQALESRVGNLHEEISRIGSELNALKNKEDAEREGFKMKMLEMNARIREFQEKATKNSAKQSELPLSKDEAGDFTKSGNIMMKSEESLKGLEENLKCINAEMQMVEAEYKKQLKKHSEVSEELGNLRRKRILVEAIVEESKLLPELAGYPFYLLTTFLVLKKSFKRIMKFFNSTFSDKGKENEIIFDKNKQTAELEREYALLGEELERKYTCPSCGTNNMPNSQNSQH